MRHRRCGWAGPFVEAVVPRQPWSVSFLFIYVRFFSSCPLSTKEQNPLTPTSITGRFWCWSPAPLSRHRLDHRGGRSPTLGPPHPSLWARLGSVIYPSLNTERCLEVLLQQLLCISMPTATLLNSFFFFFPSLRRVVLSLCAAFGLAVRCGFSVSPCLPFLAGTDG